jgi:hypothetical protein
MGASAAPRIDDTLYESKETKDVDYDTNIGLGETASL